MILEFSNDLYLEIMAEESAVPIEDVLGPGTITKLKSLEPPEESL